MSETGMDQHLKPTFKYVRRPDGTLLTPGNLPPANVKRWVMRHKADIVMAVGGGIITMEAACARYRLTREEFLSWKDAFEHFGVRGLSTRGVQQMLQIKNADKHAESPATDKRSSPARDQPCHYGRPKLVQSR